MITYRPVSIQLYVTVQVKFILGWGCQSELP